VEFSLHIINFTGRISEAPMGGAGGAQRPILFVNKPKKTCVRSVFLDFRSNTPLPRKKKSADFFKSESRICF
jgi:hypothetical protein